MRPLRLVNGQRFKPALISKGLRLFRRSLVMAREELQASPDFKGIKTQVNGETYQLKLLQASPDFKGIKTNRACNSAIGSGFKPALISKGLRRGGLVSFALFSGFKPALISKGLRRCFAPENPRLPWLQASPDFKGIKAGFSLPSTRR